MRRAYFSAGLFALAYCMTLPAHAQESDVISEAREAARKDRNGESADLFERAIAEDSTLRDEVLHEYADQLTFSGKAEQAVPLYREVLARPELPESERFAVSRGLALALAWSGRNREAIQAYSQVLDKQPDNFDALIMRGKVRMWSRDYSLAEDDFRAALAIDSGNSEALKALAETQSYAGHQRDALATLGRLPKGENASDQLFLARTQLWVGRPQAARENLSKVLAIEPNDPAALYLLQQSERALRPLTEVSARYSDQSDSSDFWQISGWQTFWPSESETVGLGYDGFFFDPSDPALAVDVHRPAVSVRSRLSDSFEIKGQLGLTVTESAAVARHRATWNAWGTYAPSDRMRIDAGFNRSTLDNATSNLLGIYSDTVSASVDFGSDAAWKLSLRGAHSDFSDGNGRNWWQTELRRRIGWEPNLFIGARYTHFEFDEQLRNGYFNPERLDSIELTSQAWGKLGAFWYDLRGTIGHEDERSEGGKLVYSGEARLTYDLDRSWQIEGYINSFSSRIDAPGGFSRTTTGLTLRNRW
jgi:tetratricopeptide (TPR) repeat protein